MPTYPANPKAEAIAKLTILLGELAADSQQRLEPESTYIETLEALHDHLGKRLMNLRAR